MATIIQAVQSFLRELEWHWEQLDEHRLRVLVDGQDGQWVWLAVWNESDTLFISYAICPFRVPKTRRLAVAEYITRANYGLSVGNFELDFNDGEVRFKTSLPLRKARLTRGMVRQLAFCGFSCIDHYVPAMMTVAFGRTSPARAIQAAEQPAEEEPDGDEQEGEPDGQAAGEPTDRPTRVARIADYLRLMKERANNEAKSHCFIVFSDRAPGVKGPRRGRKAAAGAKSQPLPRMVQLCFHEDWFAIDIPNTHIYPREAEQLVRERQGFYREAENPDAGVTDVVDVVQFDPVGKRYAYGQELEAAEDAAWILFDLWGLEPSQPFYVSASSFETDHRWERDELLK